MSFSSMLINRATVTRPTLTAGEMGETKQRFTVVYTDMPCRVSNPTMAESIMAHKIGQNVLRNVLFDTAYAVTEKDRFTIDGIEYEVVSIVPRSDSYSVHHQTAIVQRYI